ncbi:MAG TPA: TonB family protein [Candidatus Udaeobacter sp.]|jgi:TonB family protein
MNPAFLYRRNGRSIFWLAFFFALAIHLGAVALAKTRSPSNKLLDVSPLSDVEIVDTAESEPALLEESAPPPPLEQIHPDQDSFQEKNLMPPPIRAHRKARPPSLIGGTTASLRSVKATVAYAPRPVYPYEARRQRVTGSGVALLTVNQTSGTVTDVRMAQSCGNVILDNSTLDALRRWRFRPGGVTQVEVPITYTLMGVSY